MEAEKLHSTHSASWRMRKACAIIQSGSKGLRTGQGAGSWGAGTACGASGVSLKLKA